MDRQIDIIDTLAEVIIQSVRKIWMNLCF